MSNQLRTCKECKIEKSIDEYYLNTKGWIRIICKTCTCASQRQYDNNYYRNNKEIILIRKNLSYWKKNIKKSLSRRIEFANIQIPKLEDKLKKLKFNREANEKLLAEQ